MQEDKDGEQDPEEQNQQISEIKSSQYKDCPAEYTQALLECEQELVEWTWWLNRALKAAYKYTGYCTRKVTITNKAELAYYTLGKVFRFQNIISATVGDPQ